LKYEVCGVTVTYKIPQDEKLISTLKEPLGNIIQEQNLANEIRKTDTCIAVGDESAITLFKYGFNLKIAIVDYKTQRKTSDELKDQVSKIGNKVIKISNPAATITQALWDAVESAITGEDNVRIEIDGEEDLATIPCVILAPIGTVIVYGMPNQGLVVARVDEKRKELAQKALAKMEKIIDN
jgi:uncharacterized protein (UPF0218 family)